MFLCCVGSCLITSSLLMVVCSFLCELVNWIIISKHSLGSREQGQTCSSLFFHIPFLVSKKDSLLLSTANWLSNSVATQEHHRGIAMRNRQRTSLLRVNVSVYVCVCVCVCVWVKGVRESCISAYEYKMVKLACWLSWQKKCLLKSMPVSLSPSVMHLLLMKPPETKAVSQSIMSFGCCFFSPNWYLLLKQDQHTWNDRTDKEMLAYLYNAKRLAFVCLSKWELQIEREREREIVQSELSYCTGRLFGILKYVLRDLI